MMKKHVCTYACTIPYCTVHTVCTCALYYTYLRTYVHCVHRHTYLCSGHCFGVHTVDLDLVPQFTQSRSEDLPEARLTGSTGAHNHHTHALTKLLAQLLCLTDLQQLHTCMNTYSGCTNICILYVQKHM